jgi:hypothetical protein
VTAGGLLERCIVDGCGAQAVGRFHVLAAVLAVVAPAESWEPGMAVEVPLCAEHAGWLAQGRLGMPDMPDA